MALKHVQPNTQTHTHAGTKGERRPWTKTIKEVIRGKRACPDVGSNSHQKQRKQKTKVWVSETVLLEVHTALVPFQALVALLGA